MRPYRFPHVLTLTFLCSIGLLRSAVAEDATAGRVTGVVIYEGDVARVWKAKEAEPTAQLESLSTEPDTSLMSAPQEIEITAEGGIRKVAVWLENEQTKKLAKELEREPIIIDQRGSVFQPGMTVLPRGGSIQFLNSDLINHNVHLLSSRQEKNFLLRGDEERTVTLRHADGIRLVCDLHGWMRATIVSVPTPYYTITDNEGRFVLENIPPGIYRLKIGHHRFKAEGDGLEVEVGAGSDADLRINAALSRWRY